MIWIQETLRTYFHEAKAFDQFMQLKGEVFRSVENRKTQKIKMAEQHFFIKQHYGIGWKEIFKNLSQMRLPIFGSYHEWRAIQRLKSLNIPTLTVLAYGWRGWNPARRQSFILTRELPSHITLEKLIEKPLSFIEKQLYIQTVAQTARLMHENGVNHRDFYLCHLLWDYNEKLLYVIDLHRAGVREKTPVRWIIKDLAGLYFSSVDAKLTKRDLLRFVKIYTGKKLIDMDSQFWQKVKLRGEQLYRRHAKKYA